MYDVPDASREETIAKRIRELLKEQHGNKDLPIDEDDVPIFTITRGKIAKFAVNAECLRQKYLLNRHKNPKLVAHVIDTLRKVEQEYSPVYSMKHADEIAIGDEILGEGLEGTRYGTK
jgi:hypothetical protein